MKLKKAGFSRLVSSHVVESFLKERQWETLITNVTQIYHFSLSIDTVTSWKQKDFIANSNIRVRALFATGCDSQKEASMLKGELLRFSRKCLLSSTDLQ